MSGTKLGRQTGGAMEQLSDGLDGRAGLEARSDDVTVDVAVVGAGASGLLVTAALKRFALRPTALIDRNPAEGGIAYGDPDPSFVLNVRADQMGADPQDLTAFVRWARDDGLIAQGDQFLPRAAYGRYLRSLIEGVASVERIMEAATNARRGSNGWEVVLASGRVVRAEGLVLALGNPPARPFVKVGAGEGRSRIVDEPLTPGALAAIADDDRVAIIGSGLTAVDLALTLSRSSRSAPLQLISRGGRLPLAHCSGPLHGTGVGAAGLDDDQRSQPQDDAVSHALRTGGPRAILHAVRAELARRPGQCWQSVFDELLRYRSEEAWQRWNDTDRRRYLRWLGGLFDRHRHRLAPEVAQRLDRIVQDGGLQVHRGSVERIAISGGELIVERAGADPIGPVDWVLNATGPQYRTSAHGPLVEHLIVGGWARSGWGGLGIDVAEDGAVIGASGQPSADLYALGPLCRGTRRETTAIPEIRDQATAIAAALHVPPGRAQPLSRDPGRIGTSA